MKIIADIYLQHSKSIISIVLYSLQSASHILHAQIYASLENGYRACLLPETLRIPNDTTRNRTWKYRIML